MGLLKPLTTLMQEPAYIGSYWRRLTREFRFFDSDYRFINGYSFPPKSISFILTETCNLKCLMCDIGQKNGRKHDKDYSPLTEAVSRGEGLMSLADWKLLLDDIVRMHWHPLVLLTGTEPFLYPEILELVKYGIARNLNFHITTNGTLLSRFADQLVDLCKKPDSLTVTISLDGIGEVHDTIRGVKGTFDRAMEGLKLLEGRKKKQSQPWPEVTINYTISDRNYKHIGGFIEFFYHNNSTVKGITFSHLWFKDETIVTKHNEHYGTVWPVKQENTAAVDISAIDMGHVREQLRMTGENKKCFPFYIAENPHLTDSEAQLYYASPTETVFYNKCLAPWRNVAVNPHGEVIISPLCFAGSLGNVKKNSFARLWNGSGFKQFRRQLRAVGVYPACSRCCMLFDSKPKYYKLAQLFK